MTAICINNVYKTYGAVHALQGLSLEVQEGAVYGFLGPNGAGKTTTLRLLTNLARPTRGEILVAGKNAQLHPGEIHRKVGYLPEEPAFYTWMTPREYLAFCGQVYGLKGKTLDARVDTLLEQVNLSDVARRRIGGFSRGMRQRLGMAQALVHQPEILLLDEPVSALDPIGRKEVLDLIETLGKTHTVFMSTHILSDVERVCDSVAIINQGRLVVEGKREDLLARYARPVYEIAVNNGNGGALAAFITAAGSLPGVRKTHLQGNVARILVEDIHQTRLALLDLVLRQQLPVERFEVVHPSLEEVFLRLIQEGDQK